jgi:DNA-binding CsgD family transcriptional regulator
MTETEIAALETIQAEAAEQAQAKEAQKTARENAIKKLSALGISDSEITALFG